jgi:hypothetical protein
MPDRPPSSSPRFLFRCSDVFSVQLIFLADRLARASAESPRVRFFGREDPRFSVSRKMSGLPAKVGRRWRSAGQTFAQVTPLHPHWRGSRVPATAHAGEHGRGQCPPAQNPVRPWRCIRPLAGVSAVGAWATGVALRRLAGPPAAWLPRRFRGARGRCATQGRWRCGGQMRQGPTGESPLLAPLGGT